MKKFLVFVLSAAMILSLAACGATAGTASASPSASSAGTAATDAGTSGSSYPSKAITMVVPYSAGGATDIGGRLLCSVLPNYLEGAAVIVENQAGGATIPGCNYIKDSDPDGYTIGYNWGAAWVLRPQIMETGYTNDDFTFICGITVQKNALYVNADSPFQTLDDLLQYAKEHPGELNYSCGASGSYQQLICGALQYYAGFEAVEVPYEGARPAAIGMLAGDLDFCLLELATCSAELAAGSVRCLATFEKERCKSTPDVESIVELGYPEVADIATHYCMIVGPAGIPDEVVAKIDAACKAACEDETFLKLAGNSDLYVEYIGAKECKEYVENTYALITPLVDKFM